MPSKVEALVRNFLRTDADALFLVPGERMFLMKGAQRAVVGREPLSLESFLAVSEELAPGELPEALAQRRQRVPIRLDLISEPVEVRFGSSGASAAVMIVRAASSPGDAGPPQATVPAPPSPEPSPASQPVPRTGRAAPEPPAVPEALEYAEVTSIGKAAPPPPPPDADGLDVPASLSSRAFPAVVVPPREPRPAPASKGEDSLLLRMLEMGASDLHVSVGTAPAFRVDGDLAPQAGDSPLGKDEVERLVARLLPEQAVSRLAARHEVSAAYDLTEAARFRVHAFLDRRGPCLALRTVPRALPSPRHLGLSDAVLALAEANRGLLLVAGPAGAGRSTTLAALLDHVNGTRSAHVVTIEAPIEFVHENRRSFFNQREVGPHTRSRAKALRAALGEDPDVILAGALEDHETIGLALEAVGAGALVLGSIRAATAVATVEQLVDRFPTDRQHQLRSLLSDALAGIVVQALCRRTGGGRVAAFEVLVANATVAGSIRDAKTAQLPPVIQTSRAQGMQLLNDSLLDLVARGVVEPAEAVRRAADRPGLLGLLRSNGLPLPAVSAADSTPQASPSPAPTGGARKQSG